jgi:hypothetical protein
VTEDEAALLAAGMGAAVVVPPTLLEALRPARDTRFTERERDVLACLAARAAGLL